MPKKKKFPRILLPISEAEARAVSGYKRALPARTLESSADYIGHARASRPGSRDHWYNRLWEFVFSPPKKMGRPLPEDVVVGQKIGLTPLTSIEQLEAHFLKLKAESLVNSGEIPSHFEVPEGPTKIESDLVDDGTVSIDQGTIALPEGPTVARTLRNAARRVGPARRPFSAPEQDE